MKAPHTVQELQEIFDRLIAETKEQLLQAKSAGEQYLNFNDFEKLCDSIKSTYCTIMGVEEVPKCISEACIKALSNILNCLSPLLTGGIVPFPSLGSMIKTAKNVVKHVVTPAEAISAETEQILKEALHEALAQLGGSTGEK